MRYIYTALCSIFLLIFIPMAFSVEAEPKELSIFRKSYPDVTFKCTYDIDKSDWKIDMTVPFLSGEKTTTLYWSNGSLIPEKELVNKDKYWTLLYSYTKTLADPADFTEEQIKHIKNFGSDSNRQNGAGTPMFFFDALYDSYSQVSLESHLVRVTFLGRRFRVHERLKVPLANVEERIIKLSETNQTVKGFLEEIGTTDTYYWRQISGTNRKSFHSLGVAIDIMPKNLKGKAIYWEWTRDLDSENWMLTPLSKRWMPPQEVIEAFETEGFVWGGKWAIWDNMHFEYHPELIEYNFNQAN